MPKCDGYCGAAAQRMAADRRARQRKLINHPDLCKRVIERIKNGWTLEQIGNRMIHEGANTPRKCLGWKTPAEVFREQMMEEMQ